MWESQLRKMEGAKQPNAENQSNSHSNFMHSLNMEQTIEKNIVETIF